MASKLISAYRRVVAHLGKIVSGIGAALMTVDIAGYADPAKAYAAQFLGDKAAAKIGFGIFLILFLRTAYTGIQTQKAAQALKEAEAMKNPPPSGGV